MSALEYLRAQLVDAGMDDPAGYRAHDGRVPAVDLTGAPDDQSTGDDDDASDDFDDEEENDDQEEAYAPPTGRDLIADALDDPDFEATNGWAPIAFLGWATSAPASEWRAAAAAAGMAGAEQPSAFDLPVSMRAALLQADIDARIAAVRREGNR